MCNLVVSCLLQCSLLCIHDHNTHAEVCYCLYEWGGVLAIPCWLPTVSAAGRHCLSSNQMLKLFCRTLTGLASETNPWPSKAEPELDQTL